MTDAQVVGCKTQAEASIAIAAMKEIGYKKLRIIGPLTSASMASIAGTRYVVVATDAAIEDPKG